MTTAAIALTENLESVKRLAKSFTRFGYEADDLVQEACAIFLQKWDGRPEGMPAENFIRSYVNWSLIDFTKRNQKGKSHQLLGEDHLVAKGDVQLLIDVAMDVQGDTALLYAVLTDLPAELRSAARSSWPHVVSYLRGHLRNRFGWTTNRFWGAAKELRMLCER